MDKAPRYCTITGVPMYEGYIVSGIYYAHSVVTLLELLKRVYGITAIAPEGEELLLQIAFESELYLYTDWSDLPEEEWDEPPVTNTESQ